MKAKEEEVMALYRATRPREFIGEKSTTNHLAWSLLMLAMTAVFFLCVALNTTENQRNALISKACQDHVFPAELDMQCLAGIQTRQHWWQNVLYALAHPLA